MIDCAKGAGRTYDAVTSGPTNTTVRTDTETSGRNTPLQESTGHSLTVRDGDAVKLVVTNQLL